MNLQRLALLITFALGAFASLRAQSGWHWQNPLPQGNHLYDVFFASADHGWAVGSSIICTTDGGLTWTEQQWAGTNGLLAVHFTDVSNGWCVGYGGLVIHTTNGGADWLPQTSGTGTNLRDVCFVNPLEGWAVGDSLRTLHTTNGGATWTKSAYEGSYALLSLEVIDRDTLWACGVAGNNGPLYKSTNGGATWSLKGTYTTRWASLQFAGWQNGWAVGSGGTIRRTSDGGANWTLQNSRVTGDLKCVCFVDLNNGWVSGADGLLLRTTDGGTTWEQPTSPTTKTLTSIHFPTSQRGGAVGYGGGVVQTTNGGADWISRTGPTLSIKSASFQNSLIGWCVGEKGLFLRTTDGGNQWVSSSCGTTLFLNDVEFMDVDSGWILADREGLVLHSTNGGASWAPLPKLSFNYGARDAKIVNRLGGGWRLFAGGDLGWLYQSTSFGYTWDGGGIVCGNNINELAFGDPARGWSCGPSGEVRSSNDSGFVWTVQNVPAQPHLWSISFPDTLHGCTVGTMGAIFVTSDGGRNWISCGGFTSSALFSVTLRPSGHAWAVGSYGLILHSTNWGNTWARQSSPSGQTLFHVSFVSDREGWIVGDYGTILHTTDGGGVVGIAQPDEPGIPSVCGLLPNYPNPFNPSTVISYQLSAANHVVLVVYDLLGREVAVLVNEAKTPGSYELQFDASGLSSGVYLYRLTAGSFAQTRTMLVVK